MTNTVVIKLGGSVLVDLEAYRAYAAHLCDRLHEEQDARFVVVVSAQFGETDRLLALAREFAADPDQAVLDLLWSTGELRSAALLALALQRLGVRAAALDVHQSGITAPPIQVDPLPVLSALAHHRIAIVPGFLASAPGHAVVSLGRGGSDLTAVAVASALKAVRCELIKDVPGYFTADPNCDPGAEHLPLIDYHQALRMAREGCDLVQLTALEAARGAGLTLIIRAMNDRRFTAVTPTSNQSRALPLISQQSP